MERLNGFCAVLVLCALHASHAVAGAKGSLHPVYKAAVFDSPVKVTPRSEQALAISRAQQLQVVISINTGCMRAGCISL